MGSYLEKVKEVPDKVGNTSVLINPQGEVISVYRKIHLFNVTLPDVQLLESKGVTPGNEVVMARTDLGNFGLTICYDLRFPAIYQRLTAMGSHIIFIPSAFTVPTGSAHWITLLQARAIENQVYIIAPAQFGKHNAKRTSYGSSVVIDPWGTITSRAPESECLIYSDIDLDYIDKIRTNMPVLSHRSSYIDDVIK